MLDLTLPAFLAILGMAAITYAIRAGGYLLADRLPATGFVAAWLKHIPGAVLASLVAPAILGGGIVELVATALTALGYILTRNLFAAMVLGVGTVFVARTFLGM